MKKWEVGLILLFTFSMFVVAGVLYYQYSKVADYVCYYGSQLGPTTTYTGFGQPTSIYNGQGFYTMGKVVCVKTSEAAFSCPASFSSSKFLGYEYIETATIQPHVT